MKTQLIYCCMALVLSAITLPSHARDTAKVKRIAPETLSPLQLQQMAAYNSYADSAKKTVSRISMQYKRDIDSLFKDRQGDGKERWEKINNLIIRRNQSIHRINDSLRVRYAQVNYHYKP